MQTRTNSPQVAALLQAVEAVFGRPVKTPTDYVQVADCVELKTREHISDSTIKRLWNPALGYSTVSMRTLNVLSQYAGFSHYEAFKAHLVKNGGDESEMASIPGCIRSSELEVGDMLSLAWQPDRECVVRYLGEYQFVALECKNSKLSPGDTFFCVSFIPDRPLYVTNLAHGDDLYESYGMGMEHGLTRVKKLP